MATSEANAKRGRGRPKATPESVLGEEKIAEYMGMTTENLQGEVVRVVRAQQDLDRAKEEDSDLKEKQEAYKEASVVYADGKKNNKARLEALVGILDSRGVKVSTGKAVK